MRRAASLNFYLKNSKKNGKDRDCEVSIIYKFYSRGKKFEDPTGLWVNPRHWDRRRQEVRGIHPDAFQFNQKLLEIKKTKLALFEKYEGNFAEFEQVARGLSPITEEEKKSLSSAWKRFIDQYEKEKDPRTVSTYRSMLTYLQPFICLPFEKLDWNFFDEFKKALYAGGIQDATVRKYVTNLKCFLRWASDRGLPVHQSFRGWRTANRLKTRIMLSFAELRKLETTPLPYGPGIGRDFLCFEARTGARISDILAFDVRDFDPVTKRWSYNRKKGNSLKQKRVTVPFATKFCGPALPILEKHGFKMPQYSQQMINRWIREACDIVNINQIIRIETWKDNKCTITEVEKWTMMSTHAGRKTFINLGLQFMHPKVVKDLAGIDSWATIRHYEGDSEVQFVEQALDEMADKIEQSKAG